MILKPIAKFLIVMSKMASACYAVICSHVGNKFNGIAHGIVKVIRGLDTNYTIYQF